MAIRKNFNEGTKYYYGVISYIGYIKDPTGKHLGLNHKMDVHLYIRDSAESEYIELQNRLEYLIPEKRQVQKEIILEPEMTDEDGNIVKEKVTGFEMVLDESYQQPFLVENMNPADINIIQLGYEWLKSNIELFADFEDC
ncbi:hypothetical protein KKI24_15555 [bacterium]|nr:hypothetical protein [bacterium]